MKISVRDCILHCDTFGQGPPLLFIHGFPVTGEMWHAAAKLLSDRWRCIVPDLRGHGRSGVSESVTIARFSDDLAELLDALDVREPAVVIGLSMGGIITFDFYRRHRARVRALGLIDTRANAESPEGIARRETMAQTALREGSRAIADIMIEGLFAPTFPPAQRAYWHNLMAEQPPVGVAAASRALAQREESFSTLPKIDCPTLVVVGAEDSITPVATLREIHEGIGGSQFEIIPNSGHVPPVEQPEAFARVLRGFLERLE